MFTTILALSSLSGAWADNSKIRVGVLAYGTVNWELDTLKHHDLDKKYGVELVISKMAGKGASAIALQGDAVDAIVTDWIWVSRQRSSGADYSFVPHSVSVGGLMVRPDAGIESLHDLANRKLGIAGGAVDKSWLMLQAYAKKTIGVNLKEKVEPTFAAPPLLNKVMLKGEIPAALNFWHYTARLKAAGMTELVSVKDMLPVLGVERKPPLIGWVFSEKWAADNNDTITGFLQALRAAKDILATSDAEWQRLRPLTKAANDDILIALREAYRAGIPASFNDRDIAAAEQLFTTLAKYGGRDLVGGSSTLAPGTFWAGFRYE
ncbi:MAG: ABC transporter substrate-binding protein [Gammaproteobacteria bacterium]|nr:ABC transporter substrate-binding protein [Gammaproteobacteria bacterium]